MKKLLFVLCLGLVGFGYGQNKEFNSEQITFLYPEKYTISDQRFFEGVYLKLIDESSEDINGGLDNIVITISSPSPFTSINEINDSLANLMIYSMKKSIESNVKTALETRVNFENISYMKKNMFGKDLYVFNNLLEVPEYDIRKFSATYIYIFNNKMCNINFVLGKLSDLTEKEKDINQILKTLKIM